MDVVEGHGGRVGAGGGVGCGEGRGVDWADCALEIAVSYNCVCRSFQGVTAVASVVEGTDPSVYCREIRSKLKETGGK